jgi:hypothetical protein
MGCSEAKGTAETDLKFLMGPEWAKKSEIFDGSGVGKKI